MSLLIESSSFIFILLLFTFSADDELLPELDSLSDFFTFRGRFVGPTFKADFRKSLLGSFEFEEDDFDDGVEVSLGLMGGSNCETLLPGDREDDEDFSDFSGEMLFNWETLLAGDKEDDEDFTDFSGEMWFNCEILLAGDKEAEEDFKDFSGEMLIDFESSLKYRGVLSGETLLLFDFESNLLLQILLLPMLLNLEYLVESSVLSDWTSLSAYSNFLVDLWITFSIVFANSNLLVLTTVVEFGGVGDVPRVTTLTDMKVSDSSVFASTSGLGELLLFSAAIVLLSLVLIEDFPRKSLEDKYEIDLSGMVVVLCRDPVVRYLGV